MTQILVTGATGFLGRHVIHTLLGTGAPLACPIRILSRSGNPWPNDPRVEHVGGDITDATAVRKAVAGAGVVLHLAGLVKRDPGSADAMRRTHVEGTRNVCEAALGAPATRIVVASSSGTVAVSRDPVVHTESAPYATGVVDHWPYYLSKIEQEKLALAYHEEGKLDVVVLNPSILLGPGDIHRSSTDDVRAFLDRRIPNVPSGGLNFVDARDTARAFVSAIDRGRGGQRYLIGGHNMTIRAFFGFLERISGVRAPRLVLPERIARGGAAFLRRAYAIAGGRFPLDDASIEMAYRYWYCDSALAQKELGFEARPGDETLRDTVGFIRNEAGTKPGR
jgi:dihydroflavonol-4-reductase